MKKEWNRRTKRKYAFKVLEEYDRGLMSKERVYNRFWELFKCENCKKTHKNKPIVNYKSKYSNS